MGLLKFILYAIIIYYCCVFISRFLLGFFLRRLSRKVKENIKKQSEKTNYKEHTDGETVVTYKKEKEVDPGGDYVEYEDLNNDSHE